MNSYIRGADLKSEMTVVRNEFEMGGNSPRSDPHAADDRHRLRMAQLRQIDDRQSGRHERVPIENLHDFYTPAFISPITRFWWLQGKFQPKKALGTG